LETGGLCLPALGERFPGAAEAQARGEYEALDGSQHQIDG